MVRSFYAYLWLLGLHNSMKLFIKTFLVLILLLALSSLTYAASHGIQPPTVGRAQINFDISYADDDFPFLDVVHMVSRPWEMFGAITDPNLLIGANGYPSAMPDGGAQPVTYSAIYLTDPALNDKWVLTYSGTGRIVTNFYSPSGITVVCDPVDCNPSSNRVEYTITTGSSGISTGGPISVQFIISSITSPLSNMSMFRKSQETLLNSGEKWNPDFLAKYTPFGRARFMNWQGTNTSPIVRWVDRTTTSNLSWSGHNLNTSVYSGLATLSGNAYTAPNAVSGDPSSWVNGQMIQAVLPSGGTIPFRAVTAITQANPINITSPSHGFATNDVVFFTQASFTELSSFSGSANVERELWGKFQTITKVDNDNFTLNGVNSTGWISWVGGATFTGSISTTVLTVSAIASGTLRVGHGVFGTAVGNAVGVGTVITGQISGTTGGTGTYRVSVSQTVGSQSMASGASVAKKITLAAGLLPAKPIVTSDLGGLHGDSIPSVSSLLGNYPFAVANMVYNSDIDALVLDDSAAGYKEVGFPWDIMIELSNRLNVSPWFCIPALANDDYVTNAATLVHSTLNSNLIASWELSNEVWNLSNGFAQTFQAAIIANRKWGLYGFDALNSWYGWRFYNAAGLIDTVYTGDLNRREHQFSVWTATYGTGAAGLAKRFVAADTGVAAAPITRASGIAIAPYLESDRATTSSAQYVWQNTQGGSLATAAMAWLDAYLRNDGGSSYYTVNTLRDIVYPQWKTIANAPCVGCPAVKLTQYEGGGGYIPSLNPLTASSWLGNPLTSNDRDNFYFSYYQTTLFGQLWLDNANNFIAAGGEFPSQYTYVGKNWNTDGMWGMIQPGLYGPTIPAVTSLRSFNGR